MLIEPTIISFDTTSPIDSIALYHKGQVTCKVLPQGGSSLQSAILIPSIQTLLQEKGISFQDINLVATLAGPGSFTGIRIGLATAQGLVTAGKYQIIIPTLLELLAFAAFQKNPALQEVLSIVDSKRGDYFCQRFNLDLSAIDEAKPLSLDQIPKDTFLVSDKTIIERQTLVMTDPSAITLIEFCLQYALPLQGQAYNKIEPFYIRNPEFAKRKRFQDT